MKLSEYPKQPIDHCCNNCCYLGEEQECGYWECLKLEIYVDDLKNRLCENWGFNEIEHYLVPAAVAEAADKVIEAATEALPYLIAAGKADSYTDPDIGLSNAEIHLQRALAAWEATK